MEATPMKLYKPHPFALAMPKMPREDFETLVANIVANGLNDSIVVYRDQVLDGVHRQAACEIAGIKPRFQKLEAFRENPDDEAAMAFVVSANLTRRHLTIGQRSAAAASLANMKEGRPKKTPSIGGISKNGAPEKPPKGHVISQADAAKLMNVSTKSVERAAKVKRESPEDFEKVKSGEISLNKAAKKLMRADKTEAQIVATKKRKAEIEALEKSLTLKSPIGDLAKLCELRDGKARIEIAKFFEITIRLTNCAMEAHQMYRSNPAGIKSLHKSFREDGGN